ncbi:hydroxyacid dehydrogenase [Aureimonas frigidaquae]|uniref:D-isomer specific 2-hydroxyacid dehydrogenase NAD-binding protein n=1 Tax=Aureimonas frigidaquae TaxID=424757 RepID=A0A0P0Z0C1_9HYPH|nr:hydroxyacid dehydrogenase [Aureimonas frigidaquae]BAT27421.1 D-isomer specific 2-hydroxyacid dehydrogenase NAD-binding protein [Aureimonas frigidaquae]
MRRIVVSEFMDEAILRQGLEGCEIAYDPGLVDRPDELAVLVAEADALIVRNRTRVTAALLSGAARLKAVGRLGVGLDNIDLEACRSRNIAVLPARGANDVSVAEYVVSVSLQLLRGAYGATSAMADGAWPRAALSDGGEIMGRTLGLIGFGSIARETARRCAALGMRVTAYDPLLPAGDAAWTMPFGRVERVELAELIAQSDVISLHVPLTDDTRRMIDAAAIGAMKPGAILINAARGGIVDEAALAEALRAGRIGGAALDVFENEPLPKEDAARFKGIDRLILTPHIAGLSAESNLRVSKVVVDAVRNCLEGN